MLTEQPQVVAILCRNSQGKLEAVQDPVDLHREPIITFIPNHQGIILVLDSVDDHDRGTLTRYMGDGIPFNPEISQTLAVM
jgi:hypothetical protein